MKQTAVEFYREELSNLVSLRETKFKTEQEIFIQAKEMEKQQIIESRQSGIDATINGKSISNIDYYNEKFNHESNN